ncbi:MAG: transporter [Nitrospirae bacterium]|nr:transporter [Nitrospirota bacterium]
MSKNRVSIIITGIVISLIFLISVGESWAVGPFENIPAEQGLYFAPTISYSSSSSLMDKNGHKLSTKFGLNTYDTVLRFMYYDNATLPQSSTVQIMLPVGRTEAPGQHDTGIGDTTIVAGYWLIDDPVSRTWLAAGSYVDFPTGSYNKNATTNRGGRVWKVRPTIVFAQQFGRFDLELTTKYNVYTKNVDTGLKKGSEVIFEELIAYSLTRDFLIGMHLNEIYGSADVTNGVKKHGSDVRKYQTGPSVRVVLGPKTTMFIDYLRDFAVKNTAKGNLITLQLRLKL